MSLEARLHKPTSPSPFYPFCIFHKATRTLKPIWHRASSSSLTSQDGTSGSHVFRSLGWRMKSAIRLFKPHKLSRSWGGESSVLLSRELSKEAMAMEYKRLCGRSEAVRVRRTPDGPVKKRPLADEGTFKAVLGDAITWKSWFIREKEEGGALVEAPKLKKQSSWLPDPRHRWPQGWC